MSKEINNKRVPKLRFPEFKNSGEWVENTLGDVAIFLKGKGISKSDISPTGNQPCIRYGELYTHYKEVITSAISFTNIPPDDLILSEAKDVIIPSSGETREDIATASCVMKGGIALGGDLNIIRSEINGVFLSYYLTHAKNNSIAKLAQGDAVVHLYSSQLKKLKINFPKAKDEQQKIADFLSSFDELITAESQKLEAFKTYKKGLMQQLLPAEGETVPKLRFAEFKDSGEWEEKSFGEMGKFTGGGTPSKSNQAFWEGDIPWISSSDIDEESIHQLKISRFITNEALEDSATKKVPPNSILLVSRVGVGKLAISKEFICTSQDFTNFTPKSDNLIFLAYLLKSQKETLLGFSQGMAIKGFTKDDIVKLKVLMPSKGEQQKIANCLSSLDELITLQSQKLEALKIHKKGLMQQLFPSVNESIS